MSTGTPVATERAAHRPEQHRIGRVGWLRAAVLGANDGIVSTASLILGVAAANAGRRTVLISGVAGLVAGAMSMAAGEYVSVSSQSDTERADLALERKELASNESYELEELAGIYVRRGLDRDLAKHVAAQLMVHDALGAHAREELGILGTIAARPLQAAWASAVSFASGAALPLLVLLVAPDAALTTWIAAASLLFLALLGAVSARAGGAAILPASFRVAFWGALAMALTSLVGRVFGVAV